MRSVRAAVGKSTKSVVAVELHVRTLRQMKQANRYCHVIVVIVQHAVRAG